MTSITEVTLAHPLDDLSLRYMFDTMFFEFNLKGHAQS